MEGKRLIKSLRLRNILSFGPKGESLELQPLNVLIGANASGKSNLIECLNLLRSLPVEFWPVISEGGGIGEWIWKGADARTVAEIEVVVDAPQEMGDLRYRIALGSEKLRAEIVEEMIDAEKASGENAPPEYCRRLRREADVSTRLPRENSHGYRRDVKREQLRYEGSVLQQLRSWDYYPEITYLTEAFSGIALYRRWTLGPESPARRVQPADLASGFLAEDGSNLALVLNQLLGDRGVREKLHRRIKDVYPYIELIHPQTVGGTVLTYLDEGLSTLTPAMRLSDGTIRYLCLLAILCHPQPPPLICIEEPELGFHPDVLRDLGELLIEASQRTQLIVTTHSEVLISAFTDVPEAVVACDRVADGTHLRRLERDKLDHWLEKYLLGEVWMMGALGGNP